MSGDPFESRSRLFSPGERLGWEFRDRLLHWRHFQEPEPRPIVADPEVRVRVDRLAARRRSAMTWAVAGAVCAGLAGWYLLSNQGSRGASPVGVVLASLVVVGAAWLSVWRPLRLARQEHRARHELEALESTAGTRYDGASLTWRTRADAHNRAEWERLNDVPEWGAVRSWPGSDRIDIFGGTLRSWEGFLTTFGSSMIATAPPVRVLDLSEGMVAAELCQHTEDRGLTVSAQVLPRQLATVDLLAGLDADQLAGVLVESIHADQPDEHRQARAMDARILGAICRALSPELSLARVHEALRVAMREPGEPEHLSPEEREHLGDGLFSEEYVRQAHERFRSLEAHLHPVRELGSRAAGQQPARARLRCLTVGGDEQVFATDLFIDLVVQWAIRDLRAEAAAGEGTGTLIVAGADRLRRRHLERLSDVCERRGVRLAYLFRHLRDDAELMLGGGGAVVFMRMGNHEEADRAARFIGHGHRFVLSQVTRGHGANQRHAAGDTDGSSVSTSREARGLLPTTTRSRSWGVTRSYAEGTNWHYAETRQRVYEYLVEPTALQNLPEYALLVVRHGQGFDHRPDQLAGRPHVQVADCNPDILSLPRVLTDPFPDAPPVEQVRPTPIERSGQP